MFGALYIYISGLDVTSNGVGLIQKDKNNGMSVILHPNLFQKILRITKVGQAGNMASREHSKRQVSKTLNYIPEGKPT